MADMISREAALECFMGLDRIGDIKDAIAALPAVTVGVHPLVWEHDGTCFRAVDPVTGQTRLAMDAERAAASDADRAARILAALEPTPAPDAAAIREAYDAVGRIVASHERKEDFRAAEIAGQCHDAILALLPKGGA